MVISSLLNKTEPWDDLRFPAIKLNKVVSAKSGKKTFDLSSKGRFAWVLDAEEEIKLISTMKKASRLMIIGNSENNQTTDHYSMMGFTKAYNTAKKSCS